MNNKTFGIVVGVIIALALAMFAGLYMLGLTGNDSGAFNDGYEYDYNATTLYPYDEEGAEYYDDFADYKDYLGDDFYYEEDLDFYFDEDGNSYDFDDYEFEELDSDPTTVE